MLRARSEPTRVSAVFLRVLVSFWQFFVGIGESLVPSFMCAVRPARLPVNPSESKEIQVNPSESK